MKANQKIGFLPGFIIVAGVSFFSPSDALAVSPGVILSEIQIAGEKTDDEFIELYNPNSNDVDLSGFQLRRKTSGGTESSIKVFDKNSTIPGHGFFLWANSKGIFASPLADTETSSSALADNNSVGLFTKSGITGVLIDSLTWGTGALFDSTLLPFPNPTKNKSFTRDRVTLIWSLSDTHTPTNSHGELYKDPLPPPPPPPPLPLPPVVYDTSIHLNEIFANPSAKGDQGEFIELYNEGDKPVLLAGWTLKDASKTGHYTFPANTSIDAKGFLVVYRETFIFALNNSNESVFLYDPNGEEKDTASYQTTKEDISWNVAPNKWRGGVPTPGALNQLNNLPETREKVPKKGYRGVEVDFDAQGKDTDLDTLKYTWDFGDGHKSYKEKTTHIFEENGAYTVLLKTSDGKDDTEETFTIKIESFPHLKVRITSLMANPSGNDTGNEWLIIENREKKTINLKDYSIATGWKTLVNHPIHEDILIEPKKEIKLTRNVSSFTLPNQKGRIELRAPDGEVLQKMKYKLEKSIAEDVVYQKKKGEKWKFTETAPKNVPVPDVTIEIDRTQEIPRDTENTSKTNEEDTPQVLGASDEKLGGAEDISFDLKPLNPHRPELQGILSSSTPTKTPSLIFFSPLLQRDRDFISESIPFQFTLRESFFSQINTFLNELLNRTR